MYGVFFKTIFFELYFCDSQCFEFQLSMAYQPDFPFFIAKKGNEKV